MNTVTPEDMELLKRVREKIVNNPEHHEQHDWITKPNGASVYFNDELWENTLVPEIASPYDCDWKMCLAGFIAYEGNMSLGQVETRFAILDDLFHEHLFTTEETIDALDDFIRTGKKPILNKYDEEYGEDEDYWYEDIGE